MIRFAVFVAVLSLSSLSCRGDDFDASSAYHSVSWASCNDSTTSWTLTRRCTKLSSFLLKGGNENCSKYYFGSAPLNCTELARSVVAVALCAVRSSSPVTSTLQLARRDGDSCSSSFHDLVDSLQHNSLPDLKVRVQCSANREVSFVPCGATSLAMLLLFLFPSFAANQCSTLLGVTFVCSGCEPIFSPTLIMQPYLFIIFPGLKLLVLKMLDLFLLFRLIELIRKQIELFVQRQPPCTKQVPPGFAEYVVDCFLHGGKYRIRWRLTKESSEGVNHLKTVLHSFKKNKDFCPRPPSGISYLQHVADNGVILQRASADKRICLQPIERAIDDLHIDRRQDKDAISSLRDWFFDSCKRGEQVLADDPANQVALLETVRIQHEALKWQRIRLRPLALAMSMEASSLSKSSASLPANPSSPTSATLLTISFRHLKNLLGCEKHEYFCEVRPDMPIKSIKRAILAAVSATVENAELAEGLKQAITVDQPPVHFFTTEGSYVDVDEAKAGDLKGISPSLCFRVTFFGSEQTVEFDDNTVYEPFISVQANLDRHRSDFLATATYVPYAFPDRAWLIDDTEKSLARLFDNRPTIIAASLALTIAGQEVVYECDLDDGERYALRDAIPQLQDDGRLRETFVNTSYVFLGDAAEQLSSKDDVVKRSYDKCFAQLQQTIPGMENLKQVC